MSTFDIFLLGVITGVIITLIIIVGGLWYSTRTDPIVIAGRKKEDK